MMCINKVLIEFSFSTRHINKVLPGDDTHQLRIASDNTHQ